MKKHTLIFIIGFVISAYLGAETEKISIETAIQKAIANNNQLKMTEQEVKSAEGKREQAKSAYYPKLKLNAGITHLSESPDLLKLTNNTIGINNAADVSADMELANYTAMSSYYSQLAVANPATYSVLAGTYNQLKQNQTLLAGMLSQKEYYPTNLNYFGVKVTFEQPIYTGRKITSLNQQAEENQKLAKLNVEILKNSLTYDVKKAYYTVLQAEQLYNTAKEGLATLEEHYKEATAYYNAGIVTKVDVSRADAKRSEMKQKVIAAENGVNLAKSALMFVIGEDINREFEIENKNSMKDINCSNEECVNKAFENRKEIKQIETKIKMAEYGIKIAKSEKRPIIAITGEIGEITNKPFQKNNDEIEWQVGLVGSYTIFDGGSSSGKVRESKSSLEQAKQGKELIRKGIEIEVKQAYLNLKSALESIESAKKAVINSEETASLATAGYKAGLSSSIEVLDGNMALIQAKNSYIMALNQYNMAVAQLEKAIGIDKEEVLK